MYVQAEWKPGMLDNSQAESIILRVVRAAGGVICIVCPTTVIAVGDSVSEESSAKTSTAAEVDEVQHTIASVYHIKNNPSFATMPDSVCVSCMFSAGGSLHAYMNKREARAIARHLFSMPKEEDLEQKYAKEWDGMPSMGS